MPLFVEVHTIDGGVCIEDVAKAHVAELQIQAGHDVRYLRYWVDERGGKVFCLVGRPPPRLSPPCTARPTVWRPTRSTR
jgi:hypothetical protein